MAKLNIHLTLSREALSYCQLVNNGIRQITNSIIIFDENSPMIPHISLIMGELDNKYTINDLIQKVKNFSLKTNSLHFHINPPYIENVRNRYIFSDVDCSDEFSILKKRLYKLLGSKILHCQTDYTEIPHITLGHIEDKAEIVKNYLVDIKADFDFTSSSIEISEAGPKGTCINSLAIFELSPIIQ